jgi:heptosyltransferase-2
MRQLAPERNPLPQVLVIRFGALGDLCLLSWSLAWVARQTPQGNAPPITLVTKANYAPLLKHASGVADVVSLAGPGLRDLARLARQLRQRNWDCIIDAHSNLRSHLLLGLLGRRAHRRLAKDTGARLALLFFKVRAAKLERSMRSRFDRLFAADCAPSARQDGEPALRPHDAPPPLAQLAPPPARAQARLGIAPGARWPAKRWPAEHYAALLRLFRRDIGVPVRLFVGPDEESWFAGSELSRLAQQQSDLALCRRQDLVSVASAIAECTVLLTNDSGLLHVAEAVGTPVLALFGPTVREFGYFPNLPASRVIQRELGCRPCSRNGKRPCWRQDLACLAGITPEQVLSNLRSMTDWTRPERRGHDNV